MAELYNLDADNVAFWLQPAQHQTLREAVAWALSTFPILSGPASDAATTSLDVPVDLAAGTFGITMDRSALEWLDAVSEAWSAHVGYGTSDGVDAIDHISISVVLVDTGFAAVSEPAGMPMVEWSHRYEQAAFPDPN